MKARFLSVGLVGPNDANRLAITRELSGPDVGVLRDYYLHFEVNDLIAQRHDVIIVDLDHDPQQALEFVTYLSRVGVPTVMVYSVHSEPELTLRVLKAGAHEFLVLPLAAGMMTGALVRARARRPDGTALKDDGELLVFFGVKGGVGVTTIASNFAILLARESNKKTLLIDLDLPLGDIALNFGLTGTYSSVDALDNAVRLDANLLSRFLQQYGEALSVLAAPGHYMNTEINARAIDKLIAVAREEFDYVVVDSGSRLNFIETDLYKQAGAIYMVTQTGIPELRNSNRLMGQFPAQGPPRLHIVVNRYTASFHSLDEQTIAKALTRPPDWKIPNDYGTAFRMQNSAKPLALGDSSISKVIRQMARTACGKDPSGSEKKRGLFGLLGAARD